MGKRIINDDTLLEMLKDGRTQKEAAEFFGVSAAAVSKRLRRLTPLPDSFENLSEKEKKFALEIAEGKSQTQAAFDSFEVSSRASAKALGNQLMKKPSVNAAIAELMDWHGLTRSHRVQRLKNHVDNVDPNVSLKALDQSWKLDGAYQEEKPEIVINHNEQLAVLIADAEKLRKKSVKLRAELAWIEEKITDKEFKSVLKQLEDGMNDSELDDMYRWLLGMNGISEAEIEVELRKFNGGITGVLGMRGADGLAG